MILNVRTHACIFQQVYSTRLNISENRQRMALGVLDYVDHAGHDVRCIYDLWQWRTTAVGQLDRTHQKKAARTKERIRQPPRV